MARGVKTGGRKPGVPNKHRAESKQAAIAEATGKPLPLAYMLAVMHDESADIYRRDNMAKAAAPYLHAALKSMELTGKGGGPFTVIVRDF